MSATVNDAPDMANNLENRPLYQLLVRGLPSFQKTRVNGVVRLRIREIAREIEMTPQGIYKRFEPGAEQNTIKVGMARKLVELSEREIGKPGIPADFKPLQIGDFTPFLT